MAGPAAWSERRRRTNLALSVLVPVALVTGFVAWGTGGAWARWGAAGHGVAGLAVTVLAPWKSAIVRRGMRRRGQRRGTWVSVLFAVCVLVTLLSGLLHATGLVVGAGSVSSLDVHVAAAFLSVPLLVGHAAARPERVRRTDLSRRLLLRAGGVAGGAAVAYAVTDGLVRLGSLPGAQRRSTGSYEDPSMPVTQWINDTVPDIDLAAWRLVVAWGERERAWRYDDLVPFDDRVRATLDCTGGWFATREWEGVRLSRLLGEPAMGGRSILVRSHTGYARRFPLAAAEDLLVATRVGGRVLSPGHGFPVRLVAPGRRGFWWVKWVQRIEVSDLPWWVQSPFPLT